MLLLMIFWYAKSQQVKAKNMQENKTEICKLV